jgi:hypothetical protein
VDLREDRCRYGLIWLQRLIKRYPSYVQTVEGQLLHVDGDAVVWHINGGIRWGVPSEWLFNEIAPDQPVRNVSPEELEQYPHIPPDRSLLQERPTGRILMAIGGILFWVSPDHYQRMNLWNQELIVVHEALLGVVSYGGLYSKRLDHNSHLFARLLRIREKYRLDQRAFVIGVLSGVAATLLIKAL